jgi:hypothetical protein
MISPALIGAVASRARVAGGGYTTLNPLDKAANVNLSGGNLVASVGTDNSGVARAVHGKSAGLWYFEAVLTTASQGVDTIAVGFCTATYTLTNALGYAAVQGWGLWAHGGSGFRNNGLVLANTAFVQGDVVGWALDLDAGKCWVARNNTWIQGDPATAASPLSTNISATGSVFPAACPWKTPHVVTMRFDPASHSYSPPAGFTAGWTAVST